jgi:hypothetical protein
MLYYHLGMFIPRAREMSAARGLGKGYAFGNDFYQVWLTSRQTLRERRDPYSAEMTLEIQKGLFGRPLDPHRSTDPLDRRAFPYPAYTLLLFWPADELPFTTVRLAVVALLAALTLASVFLWLRALAWRPTWRWLAVIVLLVLCSYPVLEGLYAGQLGLLVAFMLATSILAMQRGRFLLAGILMALTTIKPQVTLLATFFFVLWSLWDRGKRGRYCVGFFSTLLLLFATSLAVWPHWIQSWTHALVAYHRYTTPVLVNEVFTSHLPPGVVGPATLILTAGLMIVSVVIAWRNRSAAPDSPEFWMTVSLLLAITAITVLPGQAVYDHVILLPGIFLLARRWREYSSNPILKALLATGAALLLWPWLASLSVILLRRLLTHEQVYSTAILSLPIRTAAALPFVVLGLLALAMRRASALHEEVSVSSAS